MKLFLLFLYWIGLGFAFIGFLFFIKFNTLLNIKNLLGFTMQD